jgi:DNA-binding MarR family transcriptional regulator
MKKAVDTTEIASDLRRSVTRLNRRLRQNSLGGVSPAQASLLASVDILGNATLGDLAAREQVQPPTVTRLVAALEEMGLVQRITDENDRRCQRVSLTALGRREVTQIRARKTEYLATRLAQLPESERELLPALAVLLEHLVGDA